VSFTGTTSDSAVSRAAMAVLGPLGLRAVRRALQKDLEDIATAAQDMVGRRSP
jgi:hypothetical protein